MLITCSYRATSTNPAAGSMPSLVDLATVSLTGLGQDTKSGLLTEEGIADASPAPAAVQN